MDEAQVTKNAIKQREEYNEISRYMVSELIYYCPRLKILSLDILSFAGGSSLLISVCIALFINNNRIGAITLFSVSLAALIFRSIVHADRFMRAFNVLEKSGWTIFVDKFGSIGARRDADIPDGCVRWTWTNIRYRTRSGVIDASYDMSISLAMRAAAAPHPTPDTPSDTQPAGGPHSAPSWRCPRG